MEGTVGRKLTEAQITGRAAQIITIAMGSERVGRGRGTRTIRRADQDPLAYWLGVEAILQLIEDAAGRSALRTQGDRNG